MYLSTKKLNVIYKLHIFFVWVYFYAGSEESNIFSLNFQVKIQIC